MLNITISDLRRNLKQHLDKVIKESVPITIKRGKDKDVVIMSLEEYNSLIATGHELSSNKNRQRLDSAIEKLKSRSGFGEG